jgi:hypothetical protein
MTTTRAKPGMVGRLDEETLAYGEEIRKLAASFDNCALLDLWSGPFAIFPEDLSDGLHLGLEGNRKVMEGIKQTIRDNFPEYVPFSDVATDRSEAITSGVDGATVTAGTSCSTAVSIVDSPRVSKASVTLPPPANWLFPHRATFINKSIEEIKELMNKAGR